MFSIPELTLLVLELVSPRVWLTVCLLNWDCAEIVQPHIWKSIACYTPATFKKIQPLIRKHVHHMESLNFDTWPQSLVSDFLKELSPFRVLPNIISLSLFNSPITPDQLSELLKKLPQLKEIDIRGCVLNRHAMEVLAQCINLESMAFSHENAPLSPGYSFDAAFSPWIRLRRFSVSIQANVDLLLSFQHLQDAANKSQLDLESLELSTSFYRLDAQQLPSWGSLQSTTVHMGTLKHMRVMQEHLCDHHMDVGSSQISSYDFSPLARATAALTSLTLDCCHFSSSRLREIVDECFGLEILRVDVLEGFEAVWGLFAGRPWACFKLQELVFNKINWSAGGGEKMYGFYENPLEAIWKSLSHLHRLRVLTLRHVHKTSDGGIGSDSPRSKDWFGVSRHLAKLCLTGHGGWQTKDLDWVADSLPLLEVFEYNEGDIYTTQLASLRKRRPDIQVTPV
ncbi:hypothetical protein BGX34_007816 [Mortierella sp. NVP85]|nr:hypothetical protein BGX34_007816 [Mortierella sp. NVP85]